MYRNADRACLVSHRTGNGLPNPPRGVRREFVALCVIEFFDGADQTQVSFLNQVQEGHATTGVALSQAHHQTEVCLQQMVFGFTAVACDGAQIAFHCRGKRGIFVASGVRLLHLFHAVGGVETSLNALSQ